MSIRGGCRSRGVRIVATGFMVFAPMLLLAQGPPAADAFVNSAAPTTNYGDKSTLDIQSTRPSLIRFDLSGLPMGGGVARATLRLYVSSVNTGRLVQCLSGDVELDREWCHLRHATRAGESGRGAGDSLDCERGGLPDRRHYSARSELDEVADSRTTGWRWFSPGRAGNSPLKVKRTRILRPRGGAQWTCWSARPSPVPRGLAGGQGPAGLPGSAGPTCLPSRPPGADGVQANRRHDDGDPRDVPGKHRPAHLAVDECRRQRFQEWEALLA